MMKRLSVSALAFFSFLRAKIERFDEKVYTFVIKFELVISKSNISIGILICKHFMVIFVWSE